MEALLFFRVFLLLEVNHEGTTDGEIVYVFLLLELIRLKICTGYMIDSLQIRC